MNTKMLLTTSSLLLCAPAYASLSSGVFTLHGGIATLDPDTISLNNTQSTHPSVTALLSTATVPYTIETSTLSLAASYMVTDHIGYKLSLGIPPQVALNLELNSNSPILRGSSVRIVAPSVSGQYHFLGTEHAYRPYVGLGVSYVNFSNLNLSSHPTIQALAGVYQNLSPCWAPIITLGSNYYFNDHWALTSSASYMPLSSTLTFEGPGNAEIPAQRGTTHLSIDSLDTVVQISYTF